MKSENYMAPHGEKRGDDLACEPQSEDEPQAGRTPSVLKAPLL